MSAATRARESAAREQSALRHPIINDDPVIDPDDTMSKVIDWGFQRAVARFVRDREDMAREFGLLALSASDEDGIVEVQRPTFGTRRRAA